MPRDKRPYMTFPDDALLHPFTKSIRPDAYVYLVAWGSGPTAVVKVGETWAPRRWRGYLARGATIVQIVRAAGSDALRIEREVDHALAAIALPAFRSKLEAAPYLGSGGAGWMECYRVSPLVALREFEGVLDGREG